MGVCYLLVEKYWIVLCKLSKHGLTNEHISVDLGECVLWVSLLFLYWMVFWMMRRYLCLIIDFN